MNRIRKTLVGAGLVLTTVTGGALGAALVNGTASAQSAGGTSTTAAQPPNFDPSKGGHVGANGVTEQLLTGDDATKATNAALAAVPGATIQRVETDAEGGAYEAHIVKPDGTMATVTMDSNFNVTSVDAGPAGGHGPGAPPAQAPAAG